ncbi:tissue factor isoform X2 [Xenopus laevis]|uniref:Tissue factor n=1 Tax=Xenopus laevis TaxID=8355 RepID=A0A8J1MX62_XENLA|nr:tissue factor isoform X2 [Xenopus laevis]
MTVVKLLLMSLSFSTAETTSIGKAVNVKWSSINGKTIIEWEPKPTNYTYTVEVAGEGANWKRKCIHITATECDVTDLLENVKDKYTARIISDVQDAEDFTEEFPYTDSPPFVPYEQTIIGKPVIDSYNFSKDDTKLTVIIKDPFTPYRFSNGSFKSIREIFNNDLKYTVFYRRASSTGKKQETSSSNEIVINVDQGESYCFYVQATIPSRSQNRDSQVSDEKCTTSNKNELDVTVLVAVIISVVLIVLIVIALSVMLCKRKRAKPDKASDNDML